MAFAVGELGMRLEEFYDMAWCEFLIKSYAFNRMQEDKMRHTRMVSYYSMIGSHLDPKKLPRSIESFMQIGEKRKSQVSGEMRDLFEQRMREYNEAMDNYNKRL